jgi:hypothetical protein
MSVTLSLPGMSNAEANEEIGQLSEKLEFEGVAKPDRKKERDDTLDAGTLLYIAIPLLLPIARGIGKFLATRFGSEVRVDGPKGHVVIKNVDSGDIDGIAAKIAPIL